MSSQPTMSEEKKVLFSHSGYRQVDDAGDIYWERLKGTSGSEPIWQDIKDVELPGDVEKEYEFFERKQSREKDISEGRLQETLTLAQIAELCEQYDRATGAYPESRWQGYSVLEFIKEKVQSK